MVRRASSPLISAARLQNIQSRLNSNREDWKRSIYGSYWPECIVSHGKEAWGWIESRNRWNGQTYHQDNVQRRRRACIMGIPVNLYSRAVCGAKMSLDFPSVLIQVCKKWKLALRLPKVGWNRTCWYFRWKYSLWIAPGPRIWHSLDLHACSKYRSVQSLEYL